MIATSHMLTGTIIGLSVSQPLIALPLALGSHFALDGLPHFGVKNTASKKFLVLLAAEAIALGLICLFFLIAQPPGWQLAVVCGLLAASPDFMWLPNFLRTMQGKKLKRYRGFHFFHKVIQWGEHERLWPIDLLWAIGCVLIVAKLI